MPEEIDVPDGEIEVDQDPRWFMDDLYSFRVWEDHDDRS